MKKAPVPGAKDFRVFLYVFSRENRAIKLERSSPHQCG
jgi:hypothetical protein